MTLCPALLVTARHFRFISSRKNKDRGETTRNHSFTAVRFYRNLFPSALRSSDAAVTHCLRMSPDLRISTQIPSCGSQPVSVVFGRCAPLLQWRDRAGLAPASILAFVNSAVNLRYGCGMAKEHKRLCNCQRKYSTFCSS